MCRNKDLCEGLEGSDRTEPVVEEDDGSDILGSDVPFLCNVAFLEQSLLAIMHAVQHSSTLVTFLDAMTITSRDFRSTHPLRPAPRVESLTAGWRRRNHGEPGRQDVPPIPSLVPPTCPATQEPVPTPWSPAAGRWSQGQDEIGWQFCRSVLKGTWSGRCVSVQGKRVSDRAEGGGANTSSPAWPWAAA